MVEDAKSPLLAAKGCVQSTPQRVTCRPRAWGELRVELRDGDDRALISAENDWPTQWYQAAVSGGSGRDHLQMPELRGQLSGGDGDDMLDGGSHATLQGGLGNDRLTGDPTSGGGTTVSYADANTRVRVNLSDANSEGRAREHDVLSDIRNVIGGEGNDVLTGDDRGQAIIGNGGRDRIRGGGGNDIVIGGRATDSLGYVPDGMPGAAIEAMCCTAALATTCCMAR